MFTVALIGPDGSGKSTIGRRLEGALPFPSKYVYMGVNLEASNLMLPTTRLFLEIRRRRGVKADAGPPDPSRAEALPRNPVKRAVREAKSLFRMANLVAEEWFRQSVVWTWQRRGYVVLCDRHFFPEYWHSDVAPTDAPRPLARRLHGWLLRRFYPRPDLVICFDAPAEVLFARKQEGTPELLEGRRQMYLSLRDVVENFATVDASRPEADVARQVTDLICDFYTSRTGRVLGSSAVSRG